MTYTTCTPYGQYDINYCFAFDWHRAAGWNFTKYCIPASTYWYIIAGERDLHVQGATYRLRPGCFVALPSHTVITTSHTSLPQAPIHYVSLGVNVTSGGLDWTECVGLPAVMPLSVEKELLDEWLRWWRELGQLFANQQLAEEAVPLSAPQAAMADALAKQLSQDACVKLWLARMIRFTQPFIGDLPILQHERIREACAYIRRHYHCSDLKLPQIARHAAVSEGHLRALFRQNLQMSPQRYIQQVRLNAAKRALTESSLTLAEVADASGFEDLSYFIQTFRKHTGLTPGAYRKRGIYWEL